jgi:hypothetical protein
MVSSPSLGYEPEDDSQYKIPSMAPMVTPHLPEFIEPETDEDPLKRARDLLDELLDMSCEVPLYEVNDMAEDAGVTTSQVLDWAEKSQTCHVDWMSGHIRCNEDEDEDEDGEDSQAVR